MGIDMSVVVSVSDRSPVLEVEGVGSVDTAGITDALDMNEAVVVRPFTFPASIVALGGGKTVVVMNIVSVEGAGILS